MQNKKLKFMSKFVKRLSDGKILRIRCSEIPKGNDGDFDIVWELLDSKWKVIETPKHSEYSFAVKKEMTTSYQLTIDTFL